MEIIFDNVSLRFSDKSIFSSLNFKFLSDNIYIIKGANGSGKSTLLKLAAHILRPTVGKIIVTENEKELAGRKYQNKIAMLSPDMTLYENLTAAENLRFFAGLRGVKLNDGDILNLWARVGINEDDIKNKFTENLSTGTKQRVKFAVFLSTKSPFWFLDEPTANLDDVGRATIISEVKKAKKNRLVLWATNDEREFSLGDEIVEI